MKEYKSVCPYDCPDACGLIVSVDNNKVISVRGDRAHAFTRGTLCPKMAHYEKVIHSPLRLKSPMKRVGKKGIGEDQYTRISWDEALDAIVNNFKETIDTYGSESILRYSYAGTMGVIQSPAADYFFRCIGATDQDRGICSPAKQAGFRSVYGDTLAIKPQEAQHSDFIVLWGINATATDIHILHDVNIAKKKGARVWIIDTHKTYTFSQAHEHIIVKPGSDGALALGMLHIIHRVETDGERPADDSTAPKTEEEPKVGRQAERKRKGGKGRPDMAADTKTRMRTSRASTGCIRRRPHRSECPPLERQYSDSDSGKNGFRPAGRNPFKRSGRRSERQVVHLGGGTSSERTAFGGNVRRQRRIGHRNRRLLLLGLHAPGADVGVPAAVVFARLDVDRHEEGLSFAQFGHVALLVEKRHADFAGELPAVVVVEDNVLTLPFAPSGSTPRHGHDLIYDSFEFHNIINKSVENNDRKKVSPEETLFPYDTPTAITSSPARPPSCCRPERVPRKVSRRPPPR